MVQLEGNRPDWHRGKVCLLKHMAAGVKGGGGGAEWDPVVRYAGQFGGRGTSNLASF